MIRPSTKLRLLHLTLGKTVSTHERKIVSSMKQKI